MWKYNSQHPSPFIVLLKFTEQHLEGFILAILIYSICIYRILKVLLIHLLQSWIRLSNKFWSWSPWFKLFTAILKQIFSMFPLSFEAALLMYHVCFFPVPHSHSSQSKVALQKHLTKTLAARFLPSPLAPATVCTLPSPLTLRPAAATLFQAPIFGPALFRSPPGPVRAATGPIVFAPY